MIYLSKLYMPWVAQNTNHLKAYSHDELYFFTAYSDVGTMIYVVNYYWNRLTNIFGNFSF